MWYSLGDKYEIVKEKKQRKFNSTIPSLIVLCCLFVANSWIFEKSLPSSAFYNSIPIIVAIAAMTASLVMLIIKYKKNNKELDLLLIGIFIVSMCSISIH